MERLVKGDIVTMRFPFSDLSAVKKRPAFVLATGKGDDAILCQITSKSTDTEGIALTTASFAKGRLPCDSFIRPNKLFTGHASIITSRAGHVHATKTKEVVTAVCRIIQR